MKRQTDNRIHLQCDYCFAHFFFRNYWYWVLHTPFHWFNKRYTKCPYCGKRSWMKKIKK